MRKSKYIIIMLVIICSLCICVYAENLTGLQEESKELAQNLNDTNNKLQLVREEISKNMQQIQELDEQISESQGEVDNINLQIDDLLIQIKEKTRGNFVQSFPFTP